MMTTATVYRDDHFSFNRRFKKNSSDTQVYGASNGQQALNLLNPAQPLPDAILWI